MHSKLSRFSSSTKNKSVFSCSLFSPRPSQDISLTEAARVRRGFSRSAGTLPFLIRQSHYTGKEGLHEFLILIIQRFRVVYHQRSFNHLYFLGIRSLSALPYRETDTPAISHMRICGEKSILFRPLFVEA